MKIRKLTPLASILAISSVVTPLCLTSCSTETYYTFDLTDGTSVPKVNALDYGTEELDTEKATKLFVDAVTEDPSIFLNDYIAGQYFFTSTLLDKEHIKIKEYTISSTMPVIETTNVYYPGEVDMLYPTVSFSVKQHLIGSYKDKNTNLTFTVDFDAKYENTPFVVYGDSPADTFVKGKWHIGFMDPFDIGVKHGHAAPYTYKFLTNPWSIDVNYDANYTLITTDSETGRKVESKNDYSYVSKIDTFTKLDSVLKTAISVFDEPVHLLNKNGSMVEDLDAFSQYLVIRAVAFDFHSASFGGGTGGGTEPIEPPAPFATSASIDTGCGEIEVTYNEPTIINVYGFKAMCDDSKGTLMNFKLVDKPQAWTYDYSFTATSSILPGLPESITVTINSSVQPRPDLTFDSAKNEWYLVYDFNLSTIMVEAFWNFYSAASKFLPELTEKQAAAAFAIGFDETNVTNVDDSCFYVFPSGKTESQVKITTSEGGEEAVSARINLGHVEFGLKPFLDAFKKHYNLK